MINFGRVEAEKVGQKLLVGQYRLVFRTSSGQFVAQSDVFSASSRPANQPKILAQKKTEIEALEQLVNKLRGEGWHVLDRHQNTWYELELAQGTEEEIGAIKREIYLRGRDVSASRPTGMSHQKMWGITLFVVISLFVLCVLLVFSAELRISPA